MDEKQEENKQEETKQEASADDGPIFVEISSNLSGSSVCK